MKVMPVLRLSLANHWILLAVYVVVLIFIVVRSSKEKREWLFADPKQTVRGLKKLFLRTGQFTAFLLIILICLTPLPSKVRVIELIGMVFYVIGVITVAISLHYFGKASSDQPVLDGPYRYSRNPQWVGLFLVLLGLALSANSILLVILVAVVGFSYHIQILAEEGVCRARYGASYEEYLLKVPRYLLTKQPKAA